MLRQCGGVSWRRPVTTVTVKLKLVCLVTDSRDRTRDTSWSDEGASPATCGRGCGFAAQGAMSKAMEGILVECDAPIKAYLQHLDEKQQLDGSGKFIINADLDERHLLIKEAAVEMIQQKVEELQASNTYQRGPEGNEAGGPPASKKPRKKKDKDAEDAVSR